MQKPNIITAATLKGGAGKTMNAFNIGGILAEQSKVLFIDIDPQCNLSNNSGIDISNREILTIRDILERTPKDQPKPEEVVIKSPISELPNLDIIPSSIYIFRTEMNLYQRSDRERILEKYFKTHSDFFSQYDYVIIDTNPSMSFTNINAFVIANNIILSCDISNNSVLGAEIFCDLWDERRDELGIEDNISALLISNFDGRSNFAKDVIEFTGTSSLKDLLLKNRITTTVKLKETEVFHKPINILYPKHQACEQYRKVIAELIEEEIL